MTQQPGSSEKSMPSDAYDLSPLGAARKAAASHNRMDGETQVSARTEYSAKSEFAVQIEKGMEVVESANHEIYIKKLAFTAEFKKIEEETLKRDKKLGDRLSALRQSMDGLLENLSGILRQNARLFSKMLEKDANYKRQTVAMIMNLETNMKSYKHSRDGGEAGGAERPSGQASGTTRTDDKIQRYLSVLKHKENLILKGKDALARKSKAFNLLQFKYLSVKAKFNGFVSAVIEKTCFSSDAFTEAVENFKKICTEKGLEFRVSADGLPPPLTLTHSKSSKENLQAAAQMGLLKSLAEKAEKITKQSLIYEQQAERVTKLQERLDKLHNDPVLSTVSAGTADPDSETDLLRMRSLEKHKLVETIKRDRISNERLLEENNKLREELLGLYKSIVSRSRTATKIVKRCLAESEHSSPNARINDLFCELVLSPEDNLAFARKLESVKLMQGFLILENFFRNGCLNDIARAGLAKPGPESVPGLSKKFMKQTESVPLGKLKIKLEAPHSVSDIADLRVNYFGLRDIITKLTELASSPEYKQIGQDFAFLDSKLPDTRDSHTTGPRSHRSTAVGSFKGMADLSAKMGRLNEVLKQKIAEILPAVYDFILMLQPSEAPKKSQTNPRAQEMAHILIKNLSEKLAESKTELVEAENKRAQLQERLQKEVNNLLAELNKKSTELKQAVADKTKLATKIEHFTKSIQKLEDQLIFERSRHDNLKKQRNQVDEDKVHQLEAEIERLNGLVQRSKGVPPSLRPQEEGSRSLKLEPDADLGSRSLSQANSKTENYFEKIRNGPALSQKAKSENRKKRRPPPIEQVPFNLRNSFGSNEIRGTPRFGTEKFDFKREKVAEMTEKDAPDTLYNIYHKHFTEVPKILDPVTPAVVPQTPSQLRRFIEAMDARQEQTWRALVEAKSALEAIKDKMSVLRAIFSKAKLIIEIFRSRSSPALIALVESTFTNLPRAPPASANNHNPDDLLISVRLLRTQNGVLEARLKVLERENSKLKDSQSKNKSVPRQFESNATLRPTPDSKARTPSNQESARRIQITEPRFSHQSSLQSLEFKLPATPERTKVEVARKAHFNFEKKTSKADIPLMYQTDSHQLDGRESRSRSKGNQKSRGSESGKDVNFSFSIRPAQAAFHKAKRKFDAHLRSDSSEEGLAAVRKDDSERDIGSSQELNLYGAISQRQDHARGLPLKKTLYNLRGGHSNREIEGEDLDESFDKLFYMKVIDNFYPESNEESINRERKK